jgi:hypothetical protein
MFTLRSRLCRASALKMPFRLYFQLWLLVSFLKEIARTNEYKRLLLSGVHLYKLLDPLTTSNLHNFAMHFTAVVFVLAAGLAVISREETTFLWMG